MKGLTVSIKPISVTVGVMISENNLSNTNIDNAKLIRKLFKRHVRMKGCIRILGTLSFIFRIQQIVLRVCL